MYWSYKCYNQILHAGCGVLNFLNFSCNKKKDFAIIRYIFFKNKVTFPNSMYNRNLSIVAWNIIISLSSNKKHLHYIQPKCILVHLTNRKQHFFLKPVPKCGRKKQTFPSFSCFKAISGDRSSQKHLGKAATLSAQICG